MNDPRKQRQRRRINTRRKTNSRAQAEGTGEQQCEQATAYLAVWGKKVASTSPSYETLHMDLFTSTIP